MEEQESLNAFLEEILNKKDLTGVSGEVKEQLKADLQEKLLDQINRALIAALPDDKIDELERMMDDGADEAAIQHFIASSGVNVQQVTVGTMVAFRSLYLGDKA